MAADAQFDDPVAARIVAFLERIGIAVRVEPLDHETFLPGVDVCGGALVVDPGRLAWPGDLLHEAGHIALTHPDNRPTLDRVADDPGEEMAVIAWCWAAGVELGLDPAVVFHSDYRAGGDALIGNFARGNDVGVALLFCYDMSAGWPRTAQGAPPFPHMLRWLR
jgi:hypothetical protein